MAVSIDNIELPQKFDEKDYPATIMGHLSSEPVLYPYGGEENNKAKFRVLLLRNVYPVICIALFQQAKQIATCTKGDNLIVGGMMRHLYTRQGKLMQILHVSKIVIMPNGYEAMDFRDWYARLMVVYEQYPVINEKLTEILEQMDAYGIKLQKRRDWREGAEEGSLW